jgi:hypothetical protein
MTGIIKPVEIGAEITRNLNRGVKVEKGARRGSWNKKLK